MVGVGIEQCFQHWAVLVFGGFVSCSFSVVRG